MARSVNPLWSFDVLVVTASMDLLPRVASAAVAAGGLPRYGSGWRWQAIRAASRARCPRCDLAVVLAESEHDVIAAHRLATELAVHLPTVVVLAPRRAVARLADVRGVLVVSGPADDAFSNLVLFSHAILAPCNATAPVDVDWSDVRTIIARGSRAVLEAGRGACAEISLCALERALEESAPDTWYGGLGAIAARNACELRWYSRLLQHAQLRSYSEEFVAVSSTVFDEAGAVALSTMLAITRPSA